MDEFGPLLIQGDCLEKMREIPNGSADIVLTSPPYNIRNSVGGGFKSTGTSGRWKNAKLIQGYNTHEDNMPHQEYVNWQKECLTQMMRILVDDGAIFYNHKWRVQNGLIQDRQDIVNDFPVRQIIIWQRAGGINFNDGYFVPTYEVIYLIAKKGFRLIKKANGHGDVWKINQERNNEHPAPFPVELAEKCIGSTNASVVLDPFMGSGTTGVACRNLNRDFIGIELDEEYFKTAEERINNGYE